MVWQPIDELELDSGGERARSIIMDHQFLPLDELRDTAPSDRGYGVLVRKAAGMIREAIKARDDGEKAGKPASGALAESETGLLEQIDEANEAIAVLQASTRRSLEDFKRISNTLAGRPAPSSSKPGVFSAWGSEIAKATRKDVDQLNSDLEDLEGSWASVFRLLSTYYELASQAGVSNDGAMTMSLLQLRDQLAIPSEIDVIAEQVGMLQLLTPKLRPMSVAMMRLITTVKGIADSIQELIAANGLGESDARKRVRILTTDDFATDEDIDELFD